MIHAHHHLLAKHIASGNQKKQMTLSLWGRRAKTYETEGISWYRNEENKGRGRKGKKKKKYTEGREGDILDGRARLDTVCCAGGMKRKMCSTKTPWMHSPSRAFCPVPTLKNVLTPRVFFSVAGGIPPGPVSLIIHGRLVGCAA